VKIVVLDGYTLNPGDNPWDEVGKLGELTVHDRTPADQIVERAKDAEIVFTNKTPLSAETLARLPRLKFISVLATGFNIVDIQAARARGIPVSNVPVYGTDSVAQFVFALLLELCHHVGHHDQAVRKGEWARRGDFCFWDYPLIELAGLSMAFIGFGRIGRRTAELAHAFGMRVIAADVVRGDDPGYRPFAWKEIPDAFAEADVVSLHCPLTASNLRFVNQGLLGRMKPSAFLINTSRGPLIEERDLAEALNRGTLAGAAVDVVSAEPIAPDSPLLKAKNCLITPHMAWGALAARKRLMATTVENVKAFLAGKPIHVVN
jgi:glycerate dehydrogenase